MCALLGGSFIRGSTVCMLLVGFQYQRGETDRFCGSNKLSKALPSKMEQLEDLFKHLLYDDSRRIVFCYVPKNGCSNLKRLMLVLNGLLPEDANVRWKRPSEEVLNSVSFGINTIQWNSLECGLPEMQIRTGLRLPKC